MEFFYFDFFLFYIFKGDYLKAKLMEQWKKNLVDTYPEFLGVDNQDERNPYYLFGIECGQGWSGLINDFCGEVKSRLTGSNIPLTSFQFEQIKEKFGGIRLYAHTSKVAVPIQDLVRKYEEKSFHICEECGHDGTLRTERGWYRTLCDHCNFIENEKHRDRMEAFRKKHNIGEWNGNQ